MPANPMTQMSDQEHEALSTRGLALYESRLKDVLEPTYNDQFVAIHVASEEYAVGKSSGDALRTMRRRQPYWRLVILQIGGEPE